MAQPQIPPSDSNSAHKVHSQSIVLPAGIISIADGFEKNEHSWFATSQIPTDLSIQVQDITFNVHKYPLVSRCGYLAEVELQPSNSNLGYDLKLENFPGGSETFEIILKFCYGLPVSLNPDNVAALRCASEFLQMTEVLEDGNLISKTESFLSFIILSSWRDLITVLKSCETLSPWAENLQIVRRCCDSIAWKASQENLSSGEAINDEGWWFEDAVTLHIDHFSRIIRALKAKGMKPETIGSCIICYAKKWLPGMDVQLEGLRRFNYSKKELHLNIVSSRRQEGNVGNNGQRMIVETLVSLLPPEREAVPCKFLLGLLKIALVHSASQALISEIEKRIGMVLEKADVDDLLVPNCIIADQGKTMNPPDESTMHNIDVVLRIVEYFLMHEQRQENQEQKSGKLISKLLDSYLAEIAGDPNLSITKFQVLTEVLPDNARMCHDGIYRAIDTYLKSHPSLSEHERRRLCKIMDCRKLSLDACMHAAQNDRLPLRTIIQVLFSEQVKMRAAVQGKEQPTICGNSDQEESLSTKEIRILKAELEKVKEEMQELKRDYTELQREYIRLNKQPSNPSGWPFGWRKIRSSGFFGRKVDGTDAREGQHKSNSMDHRVNLRERMSVS
ncbi:BTB/POZ domain-containing protein DOT3 [Diospyros lotus]|uniref:BTB/POZ domain-containing protein DOT3 n=1 Tax=Diospyros lotus TaxID=55363 RepID=UPI00225390C5|nr:BTB/POZ domain-containing protein DOT3 [Diospyros lotus]